MWNTYDERYSVYIGTHIDYEIAKVPVTNGFLSDTNLLLKHNLFMKYDYTGCWQWACNRRAWRAPVSMHGPEQDEVINYHTPQL